MRDSSRDEMSTSSCEIANGILFLLLEQLVMNCAIVYLAVGIVEKSA